MLNPKKVIQLERWLQQSFTAFGNKKAVFNGFIFLFGKINKQTVRQATIF